MATCDDLIICVTCGSQYGTSEELKSCKICDDPRQFVPPSGQSWTTLGEMKKKGKYKNVWHDHSDEGFWSVVTEPKFGIGQRAFLLMTPKGNVMWETITYLDDETVDFIKSKGGLLAIVISHPHWYTTYVDWAKVFNCPVYTSREDEEWLCREDKSIRESITGDTLEVVPAVTAIKVGGHFDGICMLHWGKQLFIADAAAPTMSAHYFAHRPPGTSSFTFMWSYPNMIPLSADQIHHIWTCLKPWDFEACHAGFEGTSVRDQKIKGRMLESAKIIVRHEGHENHKIMYER